MVRYSELVDRFLDDPDLLAKLRPSEPGASEVVRQIREAPEADLRSPLIRAGLLYAHDALGESHTLVQNVSGDLAAYWHGMLHRREADFDNARYWFRRAGTLPFFSTLHAAATRLSSDMGRQLNWDAFLFVGQCEQEKFGANENLNELAGLQRCEFEHVFDYTWRQGVDK